MKGDGEVMLWDERPPFSRSFTPDKEENGCPIPVVGKVSGFTDKCPGWKTQGDPSLRNCWLFERAKFWRWPTLRDDELPVCIIIGRTPSFTSLVWFFEESTSVEYLSPDVLNIALSFAVSWLSLLWLTADLFHSMSSLFRLNVDEYSVLEQLVSVMSSSCKSISESLPVFSSVGKKSHYFH